LKLLFDKYFDFIEGWKAEEVNNNKDSDHGK